MHRNFKNIDKVCFGRGAFNQMDDILAFHHLFRQKISGSLIYAGFKFLTHPFLQTFSDYLLMIAPSLIQVRMAVILPVLRGPLPLGIREIPK